MSKWSDIDPAWPQQEIKLYGPGTDSGTFDYFTEAIVGKAGKSRSDYSASEDDNVLVTGVAGDKYSLGYFGLAYYEENQEKLKLLGVDPGDGNVHQAVAGNGARRDVQAAVAAAVHLRSHVVAGAAGGADRS